MRYSGASMKDRDLIVGGALLGAVAGAMASFLFFTERGRRLRRDIEPELQTIVREAMQLGKTVTDLRKTRAAAPRAAGASTPLAWPRRS
jgi:gas vesicle protein